MRIVYMGTPDFAVLPLKAVLDAGIDEVVLVVTQPDKPQGRGKQFQMTPVKQTALEYHVPVSQPEKIRTDEEFMSMLEDLQPDLIVVAAFGQILPDRVLNLPKFGCINIHASLLPKYRGASPIQWAVINNDRITGVTIQKMAKRIDSGDILAKKEIELDAKETGGSLFDRLSVISAPLLLETIDGLKNGTIVPVPQDETKASHVTMLSKEDGHIDWSLSAKAIECIIRGLTPWPGTYAFLDHKVIKIKEAEVVTDPEMTEEKLGLEEAQAGTFTVVRSGSRSRLFVKSSEGILELLVLQAEGRKAMPADDFLRGYHLPETLLFE